MATNAGRTSNIRAFAFLGISMLSYVVQGSVQGRQLGFHNRRSLEDKASGTIVDVMTLGAKADGKTDNFESFVKAWKAACSASGPAKLVIPSGTYVASPLIFQGPCPNAKPLTIEVQGTIQATTDVSQYADGEWLLLENIDGLTITGGGTFDGQGTSLWKNNDCKTNPNCQLPASLVKANRVKNLVIDGITTLNPQSFHVFVTNSGNVTINNVTVTAPEDSPNTDGLHFSKTSGVNITNCKIATGDDCISMVQGTTDVSITNVVCGPGHGISIGSLGKYKDEIDVTGITVRNCTLSKTDNGVRIKTWPGSPPSKASDIIFEDIIMDMVKNPIIIDQKYGSNSAEPSNVKISNVHYKNIRGTSISNVAVSLECSPTVPCEGVELVDIQLENKNPKNSTLAASCLNVKVTPSGKQTPACP